jgi:hypothetical protein
MKYDMRIIIVPKAPTEADLSCRGTCLVDKKALADKRHTRVQRLAVGGFGLQLLGTSLSQTQATSWLSGRRKGSSHCFVRDHLQHSAG